MTNPFSYELPININELPSRKRVIDKITRLAAHGQSIWITSEHRLTRTALLKYLAAKENFNALFSSVGSKPILSLIKCQLLDEQFSRARFWELALAPVGSAIAENELPEHVAQQYRICKEENFNALEVQVLLSQLGGIEHPLILLLDEFVHLLEILTSDGDERFLSELRAQCVHSGLAFVVSSNSSRLSTIMASNHLFTSPFWNILLLVRLPPLTLREAGILLDQPNSPFTAVDRGYIISVAGTHPYLLQVTASAIWDECLSTNSDAYQCHLVVGQKVYAATKLHFSTVWQLWDPATRKAIVATALIHMPHILQKQRFSTPDLANELTSFGPELYELEMSGVIAKDKSIDSGYRIVQGAMLWWLADEIARIVRDEGSIEDWLLDRELKGNVFTKRELDRLGKIAAHLAKFIERGAISFIEAYAKGLVH